MRNLYLAAVVLLAAFAFVLRAEDPPAPQPALDSLDKKAGYSFGYQMGKELKMNGGTIDAESLARGVREGLAGTAPVMSDTDMQAAIMEWQRGLQAKAMQAHADRGKKNKAEGDAFLEKNKTAEGVSTTKSGLQYKCVKQGNGEKPTSSDTVKVNYEGTLIDGTVFDSSYKRGSPAEFGVTQVIPGWIEGLQLMDVGSTYYLYIPGDLAYGENPPPQSPIGVNSVLVFKIELLEIKKGK
jgi:FKBP-type peptidyl-prolyl cis-trans isomerase